MLVLGLGILLGAALVALAKDKPDEQTRRKAIDRLKKKKPRRKIPAVNVYWMEQRGNA